MIQTTTWHPDTCGCVIEYTWDDQQPDNVRKHTFSKVIHCEQDHPKAVVGEQVEGHAFHKDHISKQKPAVVVEPELTSDERKQLRRLLGG